VTSDNLEKTGKQVKRKEQHPPPLILSNVDMFVKPATSQRFVVYANDYVAERDGIKVTTTRQCQEASGNAPAGNFDSAFDHASSGTDSEREERKEQTDKRRRQRPSVSSNGKSAADYRTH
jgi:hypothetical protein